MNMNLGGPPIPAAYYNLPRGTYGVSYDLNTNRMTNDLPDGWHIYTGEQGTVPRHHTAELRLASQVMSITNWDLPSGPVDSSASRRASGSGAVSPQTEFGRGRGLR